MLSRVADSVYWMSRYIERAENVARFIDVNYNLTLGEGASMSEQWLPLVSTTGDHELFQELYGEANCENVLQFLAYEARNPNSILSCVAAARENARASRETITAQMWKQINEFYLMVKRCAASGQLLSEPSEFCDQIRLGSHTLLGTTYATMSQGEAWHFSRIGRLMERADKTSRLIDVQYYILLPKAEDIGSALDLVRWSALLRSASALTMYRRLYGRITPNSVAEFLILNSEFPRSIMHCLLHAAQSINKITGSQEKAFSCQSERLLGRLGTDVNYTTVEEIVNEGIHTYIDRFQTRLNGVGAALRKDFFTPFAADTALQSQSQLSV